jgi:predicted membrane-bound dolichyl-phosphate-mannose-protein mannosyltransferase
MNEIQALDGKLLAIVAPIIVINLILVITALVACFRAEETRGPKWMWALIIIIVNLLGPVLFFLIGRRSS